jgi:hypothetical protein
MATIQDITSEVSDNWPAFTYMLMITIFSVVFFRERRAERRLVRRLGEGIQESIQARFDRLESLVRQSMPVPDTGRRPEVELHRARASLSS